MSEFVQVEIFRQLYGDPMFEEPDGTSLLWRVAGHRVRHMNNTIQRLPRGEFTRWQMGCRWMHFNDVLETVGDASEFRGCVYLAKGAPEWTVPSLRHASRLLGENAHLVRGVGWRWRTKSGYLDASFLDEWAIEGYPRSTGFALKFAHFVALADRQFNELCDILGDPEGWPDPDIQSWAWKKHDLTICLHPIDFGVEDIDELQPAEWTIDGESADFESVVDVAMEAVVHVEELREIEELAEDACDDGEPMPFDLPADDEGGEGERRRAVFKFEIKTSMGGSSSWHGVGGAHAELDCEFWPPMHEALGLFCDDGSLRKDLSLLSWELVPVDDEVVFTLIFSIEPNDNLLRLNITSRVKGGKCTGWLPINQILSGDVVDLRLSRVMFSSRALPF